MKVAKNMIDKQLRFRATLFDLVGINFTETKLRKNRKSLFWKCLEYFMRSKGTAVEERFIPRKDGSKLRVLVIRPLSVQGKATGLLWIHGGGYFMGSPEAEARGTDFFVKECNSIIVSPDYRLSIVEPYPAALDDCYAALCWLKDNAEELGVRNDQIAVGGCSAGGGLTAALSMYARDRGEVNIAFQMPIYPMIDDRMQTESAKDNNAPVWNTQTNTLGWKLYLGSLYGSDNVPPYAAPGRATNFSYLPPTCTYVGGIEPFRDETVKYAEDLKAAGIPVEYQVYEGCFHGFDGIAPKAKASQEATRFKNDWYKKAVKTYFAPQAQ